MKTDIEAFIICWNEERLIRHTLNHYSKFCNKITLYDNFSSDNTIEVAKKFFPTITVVNWSTNHQYREDLLLKVKNNCWKYSKADYVVVCDTDELLYAENINNVLQSMNKKKVVLPVITGYNMGSIDFPDDYSIPIYQQVKYGVRDRRFDKQIIFKRKELEEINFDPGSHSCRPIFREKKLIDEVVNFKLLHFKYLSKDYLYNKHKLYNDRMSTYSLENRFGIEYTEGKSHIDACFSIMDSHLYKVV